MLPPALLLPAGRHRAALAGAVAAGALAAITLVAQAHLFGRLVALVFPGGRNLTDVASLLVAVAFAILIRTALAWLQQVLAGQAAIATKARIRGDLTSRLLAAGPVIAASRPTGEIANTLVGGIESLDAWLRDYLPQAALAVLVPAIVGAAVLVIDPLSAVVLFVTWPLIPLFMSLIGAHARAETRSQWLALSRLSAIFFDALRGQVTLKAFGRSAAEAARIAAAGERFRAITMRVLRVAFVSALVLELVATLGTAIVAVEVGLRLLYGHLPFANALTVLLLAPEFYRPLRSLGAAFHSGMAGREAGRGINALYEATARVSPAARAFATQATHGAIAVPFDLVIDRVSFTYPGRDTPALHDASIELRAGETIALVGPSGSGKSTVARLLLRFIDPDSGRVVAREVSTQAAAEWPIVSLPPDAWRRYVSWVPQSPHLFHGSVLDNLLIARPDAGADAIARALRLARADRFVEALPHGLATSVGEGGMRLSGGQAQRLALARAFLRDAPLLVLDEPTAQLDPETERDVSAAMRRLRENRTVLLIAHRLTTVLDADRVVVLEDGRVLETGAPADLLSRDSAFARHLSAFQGSA